MEDFFKRALEVVLEDEEELWEKEEMESVFEHGLVVL